MNNSNKRNSSGRRKSAGGSSSDVDNNNRSNNNNNNNELENNIKDILNKAQRPQHSIRELVKQLITITKVSDSQRKKTLQFLITQIKKALAIKQQSIKSTPLEGFNSFISCFTLQDYRQFENKSFLSFLVKVLSKISTSQHYYIRFNTCRLLFFIIDQFTKSNNIAVDDEIIEEIIQLLLIRLKDNNPTVRNISVQTLSRLQHSDENQDDIAFNGLLKSLENDELDTVRENIIKVIIFKKEFLSRLLYRTHDNSNRVRDTTQKVLERELGKGTFENDSQSWLTIIQYGLNDRIHNLKKKYEDMICKYINQLSNNNCNSNNSDNTSDNKIQLFFSMFSKDEIIKNEKIFKNLLLICFQNQILPNGDFKTIIKEKQLLSPSNVLMWKVFIKNYSNSLNNA